MNTENSDGLESLGIKPNADRHMISECKLSSSIAHAFLPITSRGFRCASNRV